MVIHVIIPTNVRLNRIRLTETEICTQCGRQNTILHRLTKCGVGHLEWSRTRIVRRERTNPRPITRERPHCPCFILWPRQVSGKYGFICDEPTQDHIGTGLSWLHLSDVVKYTSGQEKVFNCWGTIWKCSKQAWNNGVLYDRHVQQAHKSLFVHITWAYKSVISRLILTCLHVYTGPGKRIKHLEGKDLWLG
jgi:hypothetical protein